MSADNWAACPQCEFKAESILEDEKAELATQYGKIPAKEYLDRVRAINNDMTYLDSPDKLTLREDYELGIRGSSFEISYSASCTVCGFKRLFTHKEALTFKPTKETNK